MFSAVLFTVIVSIYYVYDTKKTEELIAENRRRQIEAEKFINESKKLFIYLENGEKLKNSEISQEEYDLSRAEYYDSVEKLRQRIESAKKIADAKKSSKNE
jgi:hypothetical protein